MKKVNTNQNQPSVVISANIQKTSERLDIDGNVINPRTREIIRKLDEK